MGSLGVLVVLLVSGMPLFPGNNPVSASPDELKWSVVKTPSSEGNVVVCPSEVSDFVLSSDGITFYTVDIPGKKLYKSTDSGVSWSNNLTSRLLAVGASLPVWNIAVAPDNPDLVVAVTNNRTRVYGTVNGGEDWTAMTMPALGGNLISDIALVSLSGNVTDVAIGTRKPDGSAGGDIWVATLEPFPSWTSLGLNMDVISLAFSPDYEDDSAILAVASNTTGTYLCARYASGGGWLDVISPVLIQDGVSSPLEDEIVISDIALASSRYSHDAGWIVYAAYFSPLALRLYPETRPVSTSCLHFQLRLPSSHQHLLHRRCR